MKKNTHKKSTFRVQFDPMNKEMEATIRSIVIAEIISQDKLFFSNNYNLLENEWRRDLRTKTSKTVLLDSKDYQHEKIAGTLVNISAGGLCMSLNSQSEQFPVGGSKISIQIPTNKKPLKIKGIVLDQD